MIDFLQDVDMRDAHEVACIFDRASECNHDARCRDGSVDRIRAHGTLIATGDLHDNPLQLARVLHYARLQDSTPDSPRHVILHEVIHPDRLIGGMDTSYRSLCRVAALKCRYPENVHTLLANHELSQIAGAGIVKDGVPVVQAFNEGIEYTFAEHAQLVRDAIESFIRSMALALIASSGTSPGILCAHSLPAPRMLSRFDPDVLNRSLRDEDYQPRSGSAYLMVWGRGHTPELLHELSQRWDIALFILGHQKAETGCLVEPPNCIVLNSDHERAVLLPVDLDSPPTPEQAAWETVPLSSITLPE